ncbi:MAG: metallophosphoesterase [Bryobacterales bacterium]
MRILHLTDTHLGARWSVDGAPRGWARAADHVAAMAAALAPARAGEVDAVVHTGDLFDRSRPPADAVAAARSLLGEVGAQVPVVVIPGNHERRGLSGLLGDLPGVRVCDAPERVVLPGVVIGAVPWVREASAWAEAARAAVGDGVDLLLAHQAFHGVRVPGFTFRVGRPAETVGAEHLPRGVRHVACGHLHPRQEVRVGEARVVCAGSTERTALSEAGQTKGYAVWARAGDGWEVALVDLPARPVVVVGSDADLERVVPGALVRCDEPFGGPLAQAAHARGGWILPRRGQLPLFPRAR